MAGEKLCLKSQPFILILFIFLKICSFGHLGVIEFDQCIFSQIALSIWFVEIVVFKKSAIFYSAIFYFSETMFFRSLRLIELNQYRFSQITSRFWFVEIVVFKKLSIYYSDMFHFTINLCLRPFRNYQIRSIKIHPNYLTFLVCRNSCVGG